ncbi:4Fe-4S binding protein [Acetobacterium malicum]|uniref:4Fe-4S binding protein n=1 Tax=Acetobacterium malicum TaxID=52692 RepID=UPI000423D77B|nr:4Fe-4S binding protein [Acetobacterium dehalogenans]
MKKNDLTMKKIFTPAVLLVCVVLTLLSFSAYNLVFYQFSTDASGYTMTTAVSAEAEAKQTSTTGRLYFSYDNNQVTLNTVSNQDAAAAMIYALSVNGVTEMTADNMAVMSPDYLGSFIATLPQQSTDLDGDGTAEALYLAAKTDMEFTQGYMPNPPTFEHELFPLEIIFTDRTTVSVQFDGEPLADQAVTLTSQRSGTSQVTTNSEGVIEGLSLLDIRSGITVTYAADNGDNVYQMSYQVEDNTLFSNRYLAALTPFMIIVLLSAVGIILCLWLRRRIVTKDPVMGRFANGRMSLGPVGTMKGQRKFGFMTIRWSTMIVSFFALIYGGKLLGQWVGNIEIPIFACPINQDQLIASSCYTLAHLNSLVNMSWAEIGIFLASLLFSIVVLGRFICGFLCPMGLIQDLTHETRQGLKIEGLSLNEKLYSRLKPIKWTLLLLFLGLSFVGGNFCDICPAITVSPAFAGFKVSLFLGGFFMIIVLIGSFFKRRFFCNICPLGYLIGLGHKISLFRIKKDCQACTECGACYEACPMGIKTIYTEREKTDVTTVDCIMCGECIDKCPENKALSMSFGGLKFYRASRKTFMSGHKKTEKKLKRFIKKREKNESDQE